MFGLEDKAPAQAAAAAAAAPSPDITAAREVLAAQQRDLEASRAAFMDQQTRYLQDLTRLSADMANRPNAVPQGVSEGPPDISTGDSPVSEAETALDAQRRGRKALRIDLQSSGTGSGAGAGLNVPRG